MDTAIEFNNISLRLTVDMTHDVLFSKLEETIREGDAYATVEEVGTETQKTHFHCLVFTSLSIQAYRHRVKKVFGVNGNQEYSMSVIRDVRVYISYMNKEGDIWVSECFPMELVENITPWVDKKQTHKETQDEFKKQLKEIQNEFLTTDKNIRWYIEQYGELSARYDKPINHNSFPYHTNTLLLKKGDETFKRHFYDFLEYQSYLRLN